MLFVHGMWQAAWCWAEHFLPYFSQHGYATHALSLRGHGGSEGRERLRWTSLDDYVCDVASVAGRMERSPILVGHSMGGMIVQKYLESHAASAVVLLASAPPQGLIPATLRAFLRHPFMVLRAGLTLSMYSMVSTPRLAQEVLFSRDMPEEQVRAYAARLQEESYRAYLDMLGLSLPRLERIEPPLLVLGAADDATISSQEVEATARAYGVEAEFFPHMAHGMMLEAGWRAVADRIRVWLDEQGL